jgi:hypothetical protein|tara:strand:+ start:109 stop:288 length:180 start_codon:yes stop_codon:yes gene_type:complete
MARHEPTSQEAIDEWLAKGNKITVCEPGERSEEGVIGYTHSWGRKKKAVPEDPTSTPEK